MRKLKPIVASNPDELAAALGLSGVEATGWRVQHLLLKQIKAIVQRKSAMTLVHRLGQRVRYPGAQSDHGGLFDAELHRDRVGALETDASNIPGKPIGVLGHDLHGVRAVGLEDANRPGGADPVAVQEDHDLPDDLLLGPGVRDPLGPNRADARSPREADRARPR